MGYLEDAWNAGKETYDKGKDVVSGTVETGLDVGGDIVTGLTDATGDVVDSAQDFSHEAQEEFKVLVTDPVNSGLDTAKDWSNTIQGDVRDASVWAATKAAEGYVERTEFLFGEEGWFADVTENVEQAWAATENGNYLDASLYTGEAFLNAVDTVATGGLGKQAYDWIMGSKNADDGSGPLYWEVLDEIHLMVAYENEETFFRFPDKESMEGFILELEAQSEGSQTADWGTETDPDADQNTSNSGYGEATPDNGTNEKIRDSSGSLNADGTTQVYVATGTGTDRKIIGGL